MIKGTISGIINGTIIKFDNNLLSFKPNDLLKPDSYTVDFGLNDKNNNHASSNYQFFVLENPKVSISVYKIREEIKPLWLNYTNKKIFNYDFYLLLLNNRNDTFLQNLIIETQFPGIIVNYSIVENDGVAEPFVKIGQSNMIIGLEKENISSCYTKIDIDKLSPDGVLMIVFYIDNNISSYQNECWCRSGIFNSTDFPTSDFENQYKINYDYQEYGTWYHKIITRNITTFG
jgi:hypothetical protein